MEREDGRLDGEGGREGQKQEYPLGPRQMGVHEGGELKGEHSGLRLVEEGHRQDAHQKEGRAGERVDEELDGRIATPGIAPAPDDEIAGHQGQLEEEEEEDEIESHEA